MPILAATPADVRPNLARIARPDLRSIASMITDVQLDDSGVLYLTVHDDGSSRNLVTVNLGKLEADIRSQVGFSFRWLAVA